MRSELKKEEKIGDVDFRAINVVVTVDEDNLLVAGGGRVVGMG